MPYTPAGSGGSTSTGAPGSSKNTATPPLDFSVIITHGSPGSGHKTYTGAHASDLLKQLDGYDADQVQKIQQTLIAAGYLTEKQIKQWGSGRDRATKQAYKKMLSYASSNKLTPTEAANELIAAEEAKKAEKEKSQRGPFTFTPDDPAKLRRFIDEDIPEILGHGLTEAETAELINRWNQYSQADAKSQYDVAATGGVTRPTHDFQSFAEDVATRLHPTDAGSKKLANLSEQFLSAIKSTPGEVDRTF